MLQKPQRPSINSPMAKVTIQDVARVAGLSVATVDRVLNRRPGVRTGTVNKAETAIRDLTYQPDRIAARLARVPFLLRAARSRRRLRHPPG